jgi:hypothetical protein
MPPSRAQLEGRFAIVTIRGVQDAMDAAASARRKLRGRKRGSVRRSRVVLAPRPWRYVGGIIPTGNGGKKGRFPGESKYKPVLTGYIGNRIDRRHG